MRVCLDTNILVSYLLARGRTGVPNQIVQAMLLHVFDAVIGETTVAELVDSINSKPYLRERVPSAQVQNFIDTLRALDLVVPEPNQPIPRISRDFDDDYLLAISFTHEVDLLVTGDKDLLVLGEVAGVRILTPASFVALLDRLAE